MDLNESSREPSQVQITSIKPSFIKECSELIRNSFKSVNYVVAQNSLELIRNLKFNQFLENKVIFLKYIELGWHISIK